MTKTIILASMMVLSIVLILGLSDNAFAALNMYMKIEGVDGEAIDPVGGHSDEIDVLAWSWGMSQSGGGGGAGNVSVLDLTVTKHIDKSSPKLYEALSGGEPFPEVILSVRAAVEPGQPSLDYLVITLEEAIISSVSVGGSGDEDRLTETITLNFAKIKIDYTPQDPTTGDPEETETWDFRIRGHR